MFEEALRESPSIRWGQHVSLQLSIFLVRQSGSKMVKPGHFSLQTTGSRGVYGSDTDAGPIGVLFTTNCCELVQERE